MKRSRMLKLAVLGTVGGISTLTGCEGDRAAVTYPTVAACEQAGVLTAEACRGAFASALANHEQTAPRFATLADCEQDFGTDRCLPLNPGLGTVFIPAMAGFMVASMFRDREMDFGVAASRGRYYSQPLYRTRADGVGQWRTAGNDLVIGTGNTRIAASTSVPQTRAVTMARAGFGATAAARSSRGG